jgi:DNA-binding transcriptional LysR family regulator
MAQRRYDIPPLDFLRGFEAAARTASFTKAAEELFLTQSAVSRQIKSLEDHLGVILFERRPRTLVLTEAGQTLLKAVSGALELLHDATQELRAERQAQQLSVTTTIGFASLWLIPKLPRFTSTHPAVDVRISATNDMLNLERSRVDLAIRYCEPAEAPAGAPQLFADSMLPVCSPRLLAQPDRPLVGVENLVHHVLLYYDFAGFRGTAMDWDTWLAARGHPGLRPAGTVRFNQYDQLIQAAVAGQGVALGQRRLVDDLLRAGQLVIPFEGDMTGGRAYYLVTSPASARKPHVRAFMDWLMDEAQTQTHQTEKAAT